MRTKLILAALVVVLVFVGWWLLGGTQRSRGAASFDAVRRSSGAQVEDELAAIPAEALEADRARIGAELATTEAAAVPLADGVPVPGSLEVVVVDGETGLAVPGAAITWFDCGSRPKLGALVARTDLVKLDSLLETSGLRTTADAAGRARIPRFEGAGVVVAAQGERWGRVLTDARAQSPLRVALRRDATLLVQVVDVAGAPRSGEPVELNKRSERGVSTTATAESAGPEGIARLPHTGWAIASDTESVWYVALGGTRRPIVQEELEPGALPAAPIRLVLPGAGEAEVRLLEPDGTPARGRVHVQLQVRGVSREKASRQQAWTDDGRIVFGHVGLGLELEALASRGLLEDPLPSTRASGPRNEGERVALEIRLGVDHPIATGRLLLPSLQPLASAEIQVQHEVRVGSRTNSRATDAATDGEGRFRIDLPRPDSPSALRFLRITWRASEAEPQHQVEVSLPAELGPGLQDLGDLVLAPLPIVAAGRVVDAQGRAVPGVSVEVYLPRKAGAADVRWFPAFRVKGASGPDGAFELRGAIDAPVIGLVADHKPESRLEVPLGTRDVELPLLREGAIEGSILPDSAHRGLEVYCLPLSGDRRASDGSKSTYLFTSDTGMQRIVSHGDGGKGVRPSADGGFAITGLAVGSWNVEIRMQDAPEALLVVESVVVEAGQITRDPRLQRIALVTEFERVLLSVRDPEGKPVPEGDVYHRASGAGAETKWSRLSLEGGRAEILTRDPALDVCISAPDLRSAKLERVSGEREVVLSRGIPVRLLLDGGASVPEEPYLLAARLVRIPDDGPPTPTTRNIHFTAAGEAEALLTDPGRWTVTWTLVRSTLASLQSQGLQLPPGVGPQVIEVADSEVEQIFAVQLSAETLQNAKASLDG